MNTRKIGNQAEDLVEKFLIAEGYSILLRNFRIIDAEIDIISTKNNTINFIEVKKIPSYWGGVDVSAKISRQKMYKIHKAATVYLAQFCKNKYDEISFDIALVTDSKVTLLNGVF